jgi:GxxExxY protein
VLNTLGSGFLEKIYENALAHELQKDGLATVQQQGIAVCHDNVVVGRYVADLVVEGTIVVELKASKTLDPVDIAQCINYQKATGLHPCLLLNFAKPRLEFRRVAHDL